MSRTEPPRPDAPLPDLDKQVVRLPDGRELTYYRFPTAARAEPAAPASPEKER